MKGQFGILRQHTFRHVFLARAVSLLGTAIAPIALAFAVLGQPGGTATKLGVVMASEAVAQVVFLLAGGVLADRFSRYRLMVGSDLVAFAAQGSVAGLFISRAAPLGLVAALSAVTGAASGVFYPSSRGLIPQIVDGPQLQSANALIRLSQNTAVLAGASISGVIIVGVGAGWALAIDAVSFLVSAGLVLTSRAPRARPAEESMRIIADLREGWQEVRSRQWLWVCIAQFAVVNLCEPPSINVLGPVVARQHYGGALAWSVIITAQAIGLITGSLIAMRLRPPFPYWSPPSLPSVSCRRSSCWPSTHQCGSSPHRCWLSGSPSTSTKCCGRQRCKNTYPATSCHEWPPGTPWAHSRSSR